MMKKTLRHVVLPGLLVLSSYACAQNPNDNNQQTIDGVSQRLKVLGEYLGYDLNSFCPTVGGQCQLEPNQTQSAFSNFLIDTNTASQYQINLLASYIGALLPANSTSGATQDQGSQSALIPATLTTYQSLFQNFASKTFPQYNSQSNSTVSVSELIDQIPYQTDPVNQAILNILSTPDASYCTDQNGGYVQGDCFTGQNNSSNNGGGPVISQNQVMMNVIGTPPGTGYFPLGKQNENLVAQLSMDSLLGPLLFSTGGSSGQPGSNSGLVANNQLQTATNFIRYASGMVAPLTLPNRDAYSQLYLTATTPVDKDNPNQTQAMKDQAMATLSNYLTNLRIYAAQSSVGISNLYYILSKRMPQQSAASGQNQGQTSSQALNEFNMATWRLYNANTTSGSENQQWIQRINTASSATVQKEIAILLAEINYQMYLSRQQQERILLTNTMLLIQNARAAQPSPSLSSSALDGGNSTATGSSQ